MNKKQEGFSITEMVIVVVIVGIIAAISIPLVSQALTFAENGSTNATLKVMLSVQSVHFSQKGRYARLDEINTIQNGTLGQVASNKLQRGKFEYKMVPDNPTDEELKNGFRIVATRNVGNAIPYVMEVTQSGYVAEIFP